MLCPVFVLLRLPSDATVTAAVHLMQDPTSYAALLAQGVDIHFAASRDSSTVAASKSDRISNSRNANGAIDRTRETVAGYEPQAQCLPLQVCNKQEYVYVEML